MGLLCKISSELLNNNKQRRLSPTLLGLNTFRGILMRTKNKIIEGCYKNYRFEKRYGKLYLRCLENEFAINQMTVLSLQVLDYTKENSLLGILTKGFIFSKIFGTLGMLAGTLTASKKEVYYL